jgi:hypothetical protein
MKPLNLDNSPCSPISSNCVIWQGPDIECIKLCKGDTVSDVVYKLATELCNILDTLDIKNYDLSCFNLTSCAPEDFQALINFLIERICALENIPSTGSNIPGSSGCPTDCFVEPIACLATSPNQVLNLIDYVNLIATRICNIATSVGILQTTVVNIQNQVTALQTTVSGLSNYTTPTFAIGCNIGTLVAPTSYPINVILQEFINNEWCPMSLVLGTSFDLSNAISSQAPCYNGTVPALQYIYTSGAIMQVAYPTYNASPATLAEAIENIWIALCDLRNAGKRIVTVTAGDNVTVNTATGVSGNDQTVNYTINGKEAIVVAADDITVSSATVGNDTTYTVGRTPKLNAYEEAISSLDITTDPGFIDLTYFMPVAYSGLTYTNTSGVTKDFIVHVSYNTETVWDTTIVPPSLVGGISNWVDGAIIKNAGTLLYESLGRPGIEVNLIDTVTNTVIDSTTPETIVTTPSGNTVDVALSPGSIIPFNTAFFKKVTLNNGESASLRFRSRTGSKARLLQAQFFIEEIR